MSDQKKGCLYYIKLAGLGFIILIIIGAVLNHGDNESSPSSTRSESTPQKKTYEIGETISSPKFEIVVASAEQRRRVGGEYLSSTPSQGATYLAVRWQYKNNSDKPISAFLTPNIEVRDSNGVVYSSDNAASGYYSSEVGNDTKILSNLNPGITVKDAHVFEIASELIKNPGWKIVIRADRQTFEVPLPQQN